MPDLHPARACRCHARGPPSFSNAGDLDRVAVVLRFNDMRIESIRHVVPLAVGVATLLTLGEAPAAQSLSLDQALSLAEQHHPLLRAGEAQKDGAAAAVTTATARRNPEVAAIAGRLTSGLGSVPRTGVPLYEVRQPLELGALRPSRILHAERGRDVSEQLFREVQLTVLANVRRTFYQVLRRSGEATLAAENLRLVEDLRNRIQVRVDVGEVGRLELVRAEAEVAAARALASSAQLQRVSAVAQLRAAVGGGLEPTIEPVGALEPVRTLPSLDTLRAEARTRHPLILRSQAELAQAQARVQYETALRRPQPTLWSEVDMSGPTYRLGVVVPLPIFDQRRGPIAEADAARRQAAATVDAREIDIISALDGAYERYALAGAQVTLFESGLLREAEASLRAAEVAYQLGERSVLEVLDAQRLLRTVRLNFLSAQYDRQAALVDLDELRGLSLPGAQP
jgi:cobalt-zinc-cadmium efflux system outer membrane protein